MIRGFGEGARRQRFLRRQALTRTSGRRALPRGTESSKNRIKGRSPGVVRLARREKRMTAPLYIDKG